MAVAFRIIIQHNKQFAVHACIINELCILIIAQVYRLSIVHCQMTRYYQRVPGYLARLSVSSDEISFDKKYPIRLCLSNQGRPGKKYSPLHLGTSAVFSKALSEYYWKYDIEMFYFCKWHQSDP